MFTTYTKIEDGFDKVVLMDESSGTFAEVIPSCGAILHSFTIATVDIKLNVIDSYANLDEFKNNLAARGFLGSKLSPFACRISKNKYRFARNEYVIQKLNSDKIAVHGLIYDREFIVINQNSTEEKALVKMRYEYRSTDAGYPFDYDCLITYELEKGNRLNVITEVVNKDEEQIPIQDGWHPYFKLDAKIDDLQLQLQSKEMYEYGTDLIPTGKKINYNVFESLKNFGDTILDNSFTVNFAKDQPLCVLRNPDKKIEVEILPDKSYPYLHIYTPPHRRSIALETLSALPDSFNNGIGLRILSPGESLTFKTSYRITTLN
jgi:aldose 1-epimerase